MTVANDAEFVREVQQINVQYTKSAPGSTSGTITLGTAVAASLPFPLTASGVQTALNSLVGPDGSPVVTRVTETAQSKSYSVTFLSPVGDVPTLTYTYPTGDVL